MRIESIMRKAITIDKDQRLSAVVRYFDKYGISRSPVTEDKKLVGIITERDVIEKIGSSSGGLKTSSYHVSSCMTHRPVHVTPETEVAAVIEIFKKEKYSGVPIIGRELHIVTKMDMLSRLNIEGVVAEVMNKKIVTLRREDRVVHARKIFLDLDPPLIPVVDEGICGIVTKRDVLFGLYKFRELVDKHMDSIVRNYTVEQIMSQEPITTTPTSPLSEVKETLVQHNFNALPVVNFEGTLVGYVGKDEMMPKMKVTRT